jgi:hypothetical protein
MLKLALAAWLRLHNPINHDPHYTLIDFVAHDPYTLRDYVACLVPYSRADFESDLEKGRPW